MAASRTSKATVQGDGSVGNGSAPIANQQNAATYSSPAGVCCSKAGNAFAQQPILENSDESDISMSSSEDDDGDEDIYSNVTVDPNISSVAPVEHDIIRSRCAVLRKHMRQRPCIPVKVGGEPMTYADVASGVHLP